MSWIKLKAGHLSGYGKPAALCRAAYRPWRYWQKADCLKKLNGAVGYPQVRSNSETIETRQQSDDWMRYGSMVSYVIDLMDIRLSAKTQLLQAIRNALAWRGGVDFQGYEGAIRAYLRDSANSASFSIIKSQADEAESAFWKAYAEHTQEHRVVLLLDTAERLYFAQF